MLYKTMLFLILTYYVMYCESTYIYSSFWAPLFDPRILNYQVDARFDPHAGKAAREQYARRYGPRGEALIADLGKGRGPTDQDGGTQMYGNVQLIYTYPGAPGATHNEVQ